MHEIAGELMSPRAIDKPRPPRMPSFSRLVRPEFHEALPRLESLPGAQKNRRLVYGNRTLESVPGADDSAHDDGSLVRRHGRKQHERWLDGHGNVSPSGRHR